MEFCTTKSHNLLRLTELIWHLPEPSVGAAEQRGPQGLSPGGVDDEVAVALHLQQREVAGRGDYGGREVRGASSGHDREPGVAHPCGALEVQGGEVLLPVRPALPVEDQFGDVWVAKLPFRTTTAPSTGPERGGGAGVRRGVHAQCGGNGRVVDPPLPVIVDLASLFPPGPGLPNTQQLKITKGGLALTGYATGELLAWARSSTGAWIACVRFVVEPVNKHGQVPMLQWLPAASIRPA